MKKLFAFIIAVSAIATANAQVFSVPFFATTPSQIESYDAIAPGSYLGMPVFAGFGSAARMGSVNALLVGGFGSPLTAPNMMFGRGTDVQIRLQGPSISAAISSRPPPASPLLK
jgi:hypothetical protein